jgi:hypothetical protein
MAYVFLVLFTLALGAAPQWVFSAQSTYTWPNRQPVRSAAAATAGQVLCVSPQGGPTSAPCANTAAYTTIQAAVLASTSGDEIRIARGTYTALFGPAVSVSSTSLTLRGGFENNDWAESRSSTTTIIDGQNTWLGLEVFESDLTLADLVITRGRDGYGGGVSASLSAANTLTIIDSTLVGNSANDGGGLFVSTGKATLIRTQVISNTVTEDGGGFYGFDLTMVDSTIAHNRAQRDGGGIVASYVSSQRTRIFDNIAMTGDAGGLYVRGYIIGTAPAISSTEVYSNAAAEFAGGVLLESIAVANLTGTVLADNQAVHGAQLAIDPSLTATATQVNLSNVTVASATANSHSAIQVGRYVTGYPVALALVNSVVANHAVGINWISKSVPAGDYNAFFNNGTDQQVYSVPSALPYAHLLFGDPRFVAPIAHNYHLSVDSPLINAGDPARDYQGLTDVDGEAVPFGVRADIGADEFTGAAGAAPVLQSLSPAAGLVGGPALVLTIKGTGFHSGAIVRWNGASRPTTFLSSTQLQAQIDQSDLAVARTVQVTVINPGSFPSNDLPFTVTPARNIYLPMVGR